MEALLPVHQMEVSPKDYLHIYGQQSKNINRVRFVPPRLGHDGFGYIWVSFRMPVLMPEHLVTWRLKFGRD